MCCRSLHFLSAYSINYGERFPSKTATSQTQFLHELWHTSSTTYMFARGSHSLYHAEPILCFFLASSVNLGQEVTNSKSWRLRPWQILWLGGGGGGSSFVVMCHADTNNWSSHSSWAGLRHGDWWCYVDPHNSFSHNVLLNAKSAGSVCMSGDGVCVLLLVLPVVTRLIVFKPQALVVWMPCEPG